jgi:molybdate transport system ATP-binding protein
MTLELQTRLPARNLDVALHLDAGETLAVMGPNGAGKSSILAILAGLLKPESGRAELDGSVLFDLGRGSRSRWTPAHARRIALMAQDPLLFPHLSVLDNVGFGPRSSGQRTRRARESALHWLEAVDAAPLAHRRPAELSGGQAQRVAIARALAARPRLLLLDEPLAALDVDAAPTLRQVIRRVLVDRAAVIVTHDALDALVLAPRVVVVDGGRIVESGATREVLRHPRTAFTARVAGLNMVTGVAEGAGVREADGRVIEGMGAGSLPAGTPAVAVFSPSAVSVFRARPHGSPRNVLPVSVTGLEPRDELVRIRADDLSADVTSPVVAELDLAPGENVYFSVKASAVTVYGI